MKFFSGIFLVFLLYQVTFIDALRCGFECPFVAFPLNFSIPKGACKQKEQDNAQCSVTVEIDFQERIISGELYMQERTSIASLRMETKFQLTSNSIVSTVWYTCTMSDYCDFDFLDELATNKLAELDTKSVQQKLINLLYKSTSNPTDIQCTDRLCSSNNFCQAHLENTVTSQNNFTYINESLPCTQISSNDDLVKITQQFIPDGIQLAEMTVRCNFNECNNKKTVEEAYALIRNEFVLPMNYSILNINTSFMTTTPSSFITTTPSSIAPFLTLSYEIIFLVAILFLR